MKSKLLFSLLGAATILFAGCSKDNPTPEPGGGDLTLKLTPGEVTSSSFEVKVEASDATNSYLCLCAPMEVAGANVSDKVMIETLMSDLKEQAEDKGQSFETFLSSITYKGNRTLNITGLAPETQYYIVAFAINGITPALTAERLAFTTNPKEKIDCQFDVTVTVKNVTASYDIKPSVKDVSWYFCTMTKAQYDEVKEGSGFEIDEMFTSYFMYECESLIATGKTEDEVIAQLLHTGDLKLQTKGLTAETEYIYMIGLIKEDNKELSLVSDVASDTYTSEKALPSSMTFELSVTEIGKTKVHTLIKPSNNTEKFIYACRCLNEVSESKTPEELMKDVIKGYPGPTINFATVTGKQENASRSVISGMKYYMLAFGYAGGPTTEPEMITFETLKGGNPADATFKIKVKEGTVSPSSAVLSFECSDETVYYAFALFENSRDIEVDVLKKEIEDGIKSGQKQQQMFDPNVTLAEIIDMNYWRGDVAGYTFDDLVPGTTYNCTTITFNLDGTVADVTQRKNFFSTPAKSDASVTTEIKGYFDGNEENGQLFNQPEVTKDKAIVVMKYNPSANAYKMFAYTQTHAIEYDEEGDVIFDELDPQFSSDADLYKSLMYSWKETGSYQFIVCDWSSEQSNFAHAIDANNAYGDITRTLILAPETQQKGTFAELKALFDAANQKQAHVATQGVVVRKQAVKGGKMKVEHKPFCLQDNPANMSTLLRNQELMQPAVNNNEVYPFGAGNHLPIARSMNR